VPRKWLPGEIDDDAHWAAVDRLTVLVSADPQVIARAQRATTSTALDKLGVLIGTVECVGHLPGKARIQVLEPHTLDWVHRPVVQRIEVPRVNVHLLGEWR
jgi:hypothetical protein